MAKKKIVEETKVEPIETPKVETQAVSKTRNIGPEISVTGAPKNFVIKCGSCAWSRLSSGLKADLTDINEIKNNACPTCGKWRKFHCPKCGGSSMMKRIQGNR